MKKYFNKLLLLTGSVIVVLSACKKQETQVFYEGGTVPVLSANLADTIPLIPADSLNAAVVLSWTNPNYSFSTGISSENVTYNIEIDTAGTSFNGPNTQTISISASLDTALTVGFLNNLLANKLLLPQGDTSHIQVRIVASLGSNSAMLTSNVLQFVVVPYAPPALITPPSTGTLFIIGAATPNGWTNPIPLANIPTQQFTQVSPTDYIITIPLTGGAEYKFIGQSTSYALQYATPISDDPTEVNGGVFTDNPGVNNILSPAVGGTYTIEVNFQTGKFTVTP